MLQNDMKFKMNGKRSLSPSSSPSKPWKQHQASPVHVGSLMEERKRLPMWSARESFLKEISKYVVLHC